MSFETYSTARQLRRGCYLLFLSLSIAGCDGGTGPGVGHLDVVMSQTSSRLATHVIVGEMAVLAGVPLESVESIIVTVERIEAHRVGSDDEEASGEEGAEGEGSEGVGSDGEGAEGTEDGDEGGGGWISVDLVDGGVTVDLMAMTVQEIGSDAVPAGTYNKLRLFFSDASITFADEVMLAGAPTFEAATAYPLEIPSGENTGIKVQTGFFVVSDGETETVEAVVDLTESVKNVTANPNGVKMTPVIVAKVGSTQT